MLESVLTSGLVTPALVVGVMTAFWIWVTSRRPSGIPPGPRLVLPVVGNMLSLGANPIKTFQDMRKKYGDIYSLYFGNRLVIVLCGYDVLKEALVKRGEEFSFRPPCFLFDDLCQGIGIVGASGETWKVQRRFALSTLRDFGLGKNILQPKICEEIRFLLKAMEGHQGEKFDVHDLVQNAVSNVICSIVFGHRFEYDDPLFVEFFARVDENFKAAGAAAVLNFFPIVKYLPGDFFKYHRTLKNIEFMDNEVIKPLLEEHLKKFDEENINDFMDAYIQAVKRDENLGDQNSTFHYKNLTFVIRDLIVAGAETTVTTIKWAVLYLIRNPSVQEKCFQEIKTTVGQGRLPEMSDKLQLPYVDATITEIQRLADIAAISGMHTVKQTTSFSGFVFPKDVIIMPYLSSVHKDPEVFENPEELRPERHLDSEGKFRKPDHVIPFSFGKRNCIGESLARMELFLFISAMIQKFQFVHPTDEDMPSAEFVYGITLSPKPFNMCAVLRT